MSDERRPPAGSGDSANVRRGSHLQGTATVGVSGVAALVASSRRRRADLEAELRAARWSAVANGDRATAAHLAQRLDGAYVGRSHRRAADPAVRRYRRLLATA